MVEDTGYSYYGTPRHLVLVRLIAGGMRKALGKVGTGGSYAGQPDLAAI